MHGYLGYSAGCSEGVEVLVHLGLVVELREFGGGLLQLCRVLLGGVGSILRQINFSESASAQLFGQPEILTDDQICVIGGIPCVLLDIRNEELINI